MIPQTERYREMVLESLKNERQRQLAARVAGVFKFLRSYAPCRATKTRSR